MNNICLMFTLSCLILAQEPAEQASSFDSRTWTSKAGKNIEAKLLDFEGESVKLAKPDGSVSTVKLDQLSITDQAYCNWIRKKLNDEPKKETFFKELNEAFDLLQDEINEIAGTDLTEAGKFIRWDKSVNQFTSTATKLSRKTVTISGRVIEAEAGSTTSIECMLTEPGSPTGIVEIVGKVQPKFLEGLRSGDEIRIRASIATTKASLRAVIRKPYKDREGMKAFLGQYKQLSGIVDDEGLAVVLNVQSLEKVEKQ